jgi:hypothetical protein
MEAPALRAASTTNLPKFALSEINPSETPRTQQPVHHRRPFLDISLRRRFRRPAASISHHTAASNLAQQVPACGSLNNAAMMIDQVGEGNRLTIGEGVETTLAALRAEIAVTLKGRLRVNAPEGVRAAPAYAEVADVRGRLPRVGRLYRFLAIAKDRVGRAPPPGPDVPALGHGLAFGRYSIG